MLVEESGALCVGIELNINHIKSTKEGLVSGTARILQQGKSIHVWNIEVCDETGQLLAVSRLTIMVRTIAK